MIYEKYKKEKEWKIIEKSIKDLIKNKDIILQTDLDHIVGYILKNMSKNVKIKKTDV